MKAANKGVDIINLHPELVEKANQIEKILGYELIITSGFRAADHPIEARKSEPGTHNGDGELSYAIDVTVIGGSNVFEFVKAVQAVGIERIGISRKHNFCHIDIDSSRPKSIWTY